MDERKWATAGGASVAFRKEIDRISAFSTIKESFAFSQNILDCFLPYCRKMCRILPEAAENSRMNCQKRSFQPIAAALSGAEKLHTASWLWSR